MWQGDLLAPLRLLGLDVTVTSAPPIATLLCLIEVKYMNERSLIYMYEKHCIIKYELSLKMAKYVALYFKHKMKLSL